MWEWKSTESNEEPLKSLELIATSDLVMTGIRHINFPKSLAKKIFICYNSPNVLCSVAPGSLLNIPWKL